MHIFTLTLNPALDISGTVENIIPDEKNYIHTERRDPGGNGINSARMIARLSKDSQVTPPASLVTLGFLGGPTGNELIHLLNKEQIRTQFTRIEENTRTNVTVTNQSTHQQTRLAFHGPSISPSEKKKLLDTLLSLPKNSLLLIGGSLPKNCPDSFYASIIQKLARRKDIFIALDVPGKFLKPVFKLNSLKQVILVKPNHVELEDWVGKKLKTASQLIQAGQKMASFLGENPYAAICVSLGKEGALLIQKNGIFRAVPPSIQAKGSVGAGDSFVGGYCLKVGPSLFNPSQLEHEIIATITNALQYGIAASAATAQNYGTSLGSLKEAKLLLKKVSLFKLL